MTYKDWNIEELTGYKPKTTFYMDFSIADAFGLNAIQDTYKRSFEGWKSNIEYLTELAMALNWKIIEHYKHDDEKARLYDKLYNEVDSYCMANLEDDDLDYYLRTTD